MHRRIFVTGTGTDVGKTLAAAILTQALQAAYWKPVQAGNLADTDRMLVESLIQPPAFTMPEQYKLSVPASPHDAARQDGLSIDLDALQPPEEPSNHLVIEGAGGLMVPLNRESLVIDLIPQLASEVILVSANYLGSINHTLLSVEALKSRNISVTGIIFNGKRYPAGEDWITRQTGVPCLGRLEPDETINPAMVQRYAEAWHL